MKFEEAMKKAIKGAKIASSRWPKKVYLYVANKEIFVVQNSGNEQKMSIADVLNWFRLDREWDIIPDKKETLSDKICGNEQYTENHIHKDDVKNSVKELKEKISSNSKTMSEHYIFTKLVDEVFGDEFK